MAQNKFAKNNNHVVMDKGVSWATKAIGMPIPKLNPKYACGITKNLFVKG